MFLNDSIIQWESKIQLEYILYFNGVLINTIKI